VDRSIPGFGAAFPGAQFRPNRPPVKLSFVQRRAKLSLVLQSTTHFSRIVPARGQEKITIFCRNPSPATKRQAEAPGPSPPPVRAEENRQDSRQRNQEHEMI
jgi:hypothetical protein